LEGKYTVFLLKQRLDLEFLFVSETEPILLILFREMLVGILVSIPADLYVKTHNFLHDICALPCIYISGV
jgi:hypothetical protein